MKNVPLRVRKRTWAIDIQKSIRSTEKHPLFNVQNPTWETLNMSWRNSIERNKWTRQVHRFESIILSTLFFVAVLCAIIWFLFIIAWSQWLNVKADNVIGDNLKDCKSVFTNKQYQVICTLSKIAEPGINRQEIHKLEREVEWQVYFPSTTDSYDIDKLARAVSQHETWGCKKGSAMYNNCFGIMSFKHWHRAYKHYRSKIESYNDFKRIWKSYYGGLPTYAMTKKYSGNDRAWVWRDNVLYFYNK